MRDGRGGGGEEMLGKGRGKEWKVKGGGNVQRGGLDLEREVQEEVEENWRIKRVEGVNEKDKRSRSARNEEGRLEK